MRGKKLLCAFQFGAVVYLRLDTDGTQGMVTAVKFMIDGGVYYEVSWSNRTTTSHYEMELTTVRSFKAAEA